jgi:hypothetical protein
MKLRRIIDGVVGVATIWRPLSFPFLIGTLAVWFVESRVLAAQDGPDLESAFYVLAFIGFASSAILFTWALLAATSIGVARKRSFAEFIIVLFVATLPVGFFQAINGQSSIMLLVWGWFLHPSSMSTWIETMIANTSTYLVLFGITSTAAYTITWRRASHPREP